MNEEGSRVDKRTDAGLVVTTAVVVPPDSTAGACPQCFYLQHGFHRGEAPREPDDLRDCARDSNPDAKCREHRQWASGDPPPTRSCMLCGHLRELVSFSAISCDGVCGPCKAQWERGKAEPSSLSTPSAAICASLTLVAQRISHERQALSMANDKPQMATREPQRAARQQFLVVDLGSILQTLSEQKAQGARIVSICPHYNAVAMLIGYLVVVEESQ